MSRSFVTRRSVLGLLAGLGALPLAAACGGAATPTPAPAGAQSAGAKPPAEAPKPAAAEPTKPAAAAPAATKPAAAAAPAAAPIQARKGQKISHLRENGFIKDNDDYLSQKLLPKYKEVTGNEVEIEWISVNDQNPKILAAIEAKAGPDLIDWGASAPHLLAQSAIDVSEIAKRREAEAGPWYDVARQSGLVQGVWRGVPYWLVPPAMTYREDWFKEVGATKFPDNWQDLLKYGEQLKKNGHPGGLALGPATGDANNAAYGMLWSFGGKETEADGKTVVINSKETRASVEFYKELYQKTMTPDVLSWGDVHNNRAFHAGQISWTQNGASIYYVAKKEFPDIAKNTNHAANPKGPAGPATLTGPNAWLILNYTKVKDEALQFVDWVTTRAQLWDWIQVGDGYFVGILKAYDDSPMWGKDPKMIEFKNMAQTSKLEGWPGPPSRATAEARTKFVLKDMYAKAIGGESTDSVVTWAEGQLKEIYGRK